MMLLCRDYPGKNCNKDEACEGNATKRLHKKRREREKEERKEVWAEKKNLQRNFLEERKTREDRQNAHTVKSFTSLYSKRKRNGTRLLVNHFLCFFLSFFLAGWLGGTTKEEIERKAKGYLLRERESLSKARMECFGVWDFVKKERAKALSTYRKKEWTIVKDGTIAGKRRRE